MENKYLVEECAVLTPRDVGRRWDRIRKLGVNNLKGRENISYWFDDISNPSQLFVSVDGHEPQTFKWELVAITFGMKQYFYCECGYRAMKLYLPQNGKEFKCRQCHGLQYFLTTFNKNSVAGREFYKMSRLQKLTESRANMGRILYNGKFSERFERFIGLCDKAGLDDIVRGFKQLKTLIEG